MVSGGFRIDPDRLTSEAGGYDGQSEAVDRAQKELSAALAAEGRCWGGDEAGTQFSHGYLPKVDEAMKALTGLAKALLDIKGQLVASANTQREVDHAHHTGFDSAAT